MFVLTSPVQVQSGLLLVFVEIMPDKVVLDHKKSYLVCSRGVKKIFFWYCPLGVGGQKRENEKKISFYFERSIKQIFFVGGAIFTLKLKKSG